MTLSTILLATTIALCGLAALGAPAETGVSREPPQETASDGALAGYRHRVLVSTDIGGTDPDDFQSMIHLLAYADVLDIEGLVSSPYGPGRTEHILQVLDSYAKDYAHLRTHSEGYPTPEALRAITKQGETEVAPYAGVRNPTEGSDWIARCARGTDPRPLHVLVWGGIEDLAQALHDAPDILPKLRVYWIGGPNKKWSPDAYQYVVTHHPNLWIIEANGTYCGWFTGGNQSAGWSNKEFGIRQVAGTGALGALFAHQLGGVIKMGDTPSVARLLRGASEDPSMPSWGGRYVRAWARPHVVFQRLTTAEDRMEQFGILELVLRLGSNTRSHPQAAMRIENQSLTGDFGLEGSVRFRFSPKAAKTYQYAILSNIPELDGKTGEVTALPPAPKLARNPSPSLPHWWTDDPAPEVAEGAHVGAKTVSQWREEFLGDFASRMRRCQSPADGKASLGSRPLHP